MSKKFKLGVIGNPIEHSLSPFIHSRFARQENINLDYQAYKVDEDGFHSFINEFFADSLAKGLNVTLPFKKPAAEIEGSISNEAKQIDAVNTISQINNKLFLDSTDGIGFIEDLQEKKINLKNKTALVTGAGKGLGKACAIALAEAGAKVIILSRTKSDLDKVSKIIKKTKGSSKSLL